MPLTRGMIVGYDVELMTLRFTMVDASARIIDCAISGSALDQLCGARRSAGPADRQIQFLKHRDTIEEARVRTVRCPRERAAYIGRDFRQAYSR